ncbi:hypothetical protein [Aliikangiella maris]|uniref:IS110 family transposase n=2 Tax=Aliikangiella maris TaxID=3162458 RepID=A0ABV2BQK9_9GAMM
MGSITRVGVDIAKSIFHIHAVDRFSEVQWKGKYSRNKWLAAIVKKVPEGAVIAKEACGSANYWGRELEKCSGQVTLATDLEFFQ